MGKKIAFYERGDKVTFQPYPGIEQLKGVIVTVDSNGILEDPNNIYYDIWSENTLYKHIRQEQVKPFKEESKGN